MASFPFIATAASASILPSHRFRRFHFLRSRPPPLITESPSRRRLLQLSLPPPPRRQFVCRGSGGSSSAVEERKGAEGQGKVRIRVRLDHQVRFGEHVVILGSDGGLGSWKKGVPMAWTAEGWVAELELDGGGFVEYKFAILSDGGKVWEDGENRVLELPVVGVFDMVCRWNETGKSVELIGTGPDEQVGEVEEEGEESDDAEEGNGSVEDVEQSAFVEQWQGRPVSFMRSNEHRGRETERIWITEGLEGVPLALVEGDRGARNWWRKVK